VSRSQAGDVSTLVIEDAPRTTQKPVVSTLVIEDAPRTTQKPVVSTLVIEDAPSNHPKAGCLEACDQRRTLHPCAPRNGVVARSLDRLRAQRLLCARCFPEGRLSGISQKTL
jgi:hypothetical protein